MVAGRGVISLVVLLYVGRSEKHVQKAFPVPVKDRVTLNVHTTYTSKSLCCYEKPFEVAGARVRM